MKNPARFSLVRRVLFPYSGEEPLTPMQGLRVVLVWTLLFSLPLALCVLALTRLERLSVDGTLTGLMFAFLSGACIFGILGALVVIMSNRAARFRQAWKARNGQS